MDTSLITAVTTGVLIFIVGQYFLKLVLEPVVELRRTIGEIGSILSANHDVLIVPTKYDAEQRKDIAEKVERLAGKLFGDIMALPGYEYIRLPFSLPPKTDALEAAYNLKSIVGISQSGADWTLEKNWHLTIEVFELLRAPIPKQIQADKERLLSNEAGKRDRV